MNKTMFEVLRRNIRGALERRGNRIEDGVEKMEQALANARSDKLYEHLADTAHHVELLAKDLRETMTCFHSDLQIMEALAPCRPYPLAREVQIALEDDCISIKMAAMLPYPSDGPVYYIHEQLDQALERFIVERNLPRPFYTERAAVVFLHHYTGGAKVNRQLRDYDNVEHRCITNVICDHLLWGDSPKCMIAMDVLAPGESNFTEVCIMPVPAFREFIMSEKLTFNLD